LSILCSIYGYYAQCRLFWSHQRVLNGLASNAVPAVRFAELFLDREIVLAFDRMRRERHIAVYDMAGTIPEEEAKNAVSRAEGFLDVIGGPSPLRVFGFRLYEGEICRPTGRTQALDVDGHLDYPKRNSKIPIANFKGIRYPELYYP
jgi:hypothetical protein